MTKNQHEIEDTYAVDTDTDLPDLTKVAGVASVEDVEVHELAATYFDTDDLVLASAGISLRRRTGGDDEGWHLKLPSKQGKLEVHESLARATYTVPKPLRTLLVAHTRDATLRPVALIQTRRRLHRLLDETVRVLAEFCDDRVTAQLMIKVAGDDAPVTWREWELELVEGGTELLEASAPLITGAGGPPLSRSKLQHALGRFVPASPERVLSQPTRFSTTAAVIQPRIREQLESIRRYDPLVRHDARDAIHKMRVAVRRLRNALATYRPALVREQTDPVRDELKWLAAALGEPRDAEVMRARLEEMLAGEPPEVVRGAGIKRMDVEMGKEYSRARGRLLEAMSSDRYFTLLDCLEVLATDPPWHDKASLPVDELLRGRVRHDYRRLAVRVARADDAVDEDRVHRLHEARKVVKRVRYALEPLEGIYGKPGRKLETAMKRVQSRLGEHNDAAVNQERLRQLGDEATSRGDNAFVFGALHEREEGVMVESHAAFVHEWSRASRKKLRRWLSD